MSDSTKSKEENTNTEFNLEPKENKKSKKTLSNDSLEAMSEYVNRDRY